MQVFVVGAAIREPMSQTRIAAAGAGTGSQPRFEKHGRALQVSSSACRMARRICRCGRQVIYDLSKLKTLTAAQQPPTLSRNRQAHRARIVDFPARTFNRLACPTIGRQGFRWSFRRELWNSPVISRHASTDVAFCDDADQHEG